MSSVSNGLYFLTLPLVSVVRVIYRKIRHVRYLYIKRNVEKGWGARYTLGARYLSKNTVIKIKYEKYSNIIRLEMVSSIQAVSENYIKKKKYEFSIYHVIQ